MTRRFFSWFLTTLLYGLLYVVVLVALVAVLVLFAIGAASRMPANPSETGQGAFSAPRGAPQGLAAPSVRAAALLGAPNRNAAESPGGLSFGRAVLSGAVASGAPLHQAPEEAAPATAPTAGVIRPIPAVARPSLSIYAKSGSCDSPCFAAVGSPGIDTVVRSGLASWMPERYGSTYLALPDGPGLRVRICGPGDCVVMVSNDAGPDLAMQRRGRVADIAVGVWERVCGVSRALGLCPVSVVVMGRVR